MTPRELLEYTALRDTIRERGTARLWIVVLGLLAWSALNVTTASLAPTPAMSLVPLLLLATVFEVIFSMHTGVERVGRYIQVFHEPNTGDAAWEETAMAFGRAFPGAGMDALFSPLFAVAALLNLLPVVVAGPLPIEWLVLGAVHLLFVIRIWSARRQSARQRALDLERFRQLKNNSGQQG